MKKFNLRTSLLLIMGSLIISTSCSKKTEDFVGVYTFYHPYNREVTGF